MNWKLRPRELFRSRTSGGCAGVGLIFSLAATAIAILIIMAGARLVGSPEAWREGRAPVTEAETDPEKWRELLQDLSDLAIADEEVRALLTPEQIQSRWLGEAPATDADIAAAEARLGLRLPPSYRAFLKVSNGWNWPNSFVARLAGTSDIGWTREKDADLIRGWEEGSRYATAQFGAPPPSPEDHLAQTILISTPHEEDDAAYFMLNPETRSNGEFEAWFFSSWNPGANAHPSFWHLMVDVRYSIRDMQEER